MHYIYDITGMYFWQDGQTALMGASYGGYDESVQLLLDRGAEVNHKDKVSRFDIANTNGTLFFIWQIWIVFYV